MKPHLKGLTKTQIANLHKLAMYLLDEKNLKAEFDMELFSDAPEDAHVCGSIGCAVGHGPYAGIIKKEKTWRGYCFNAFGIERDSCEWWYLFTARWCDFDNTPKGAARRIIRFLSSGVPEGFKEPSKEFIL